MKIDWMKIHCFGDAPAAARGCAEYILEQMGAAIRERGSAAIAISGGSSPRPMFELFGKTPFAWEKTHIFWVDERAVPPTHSRSNFKLAADMWLSPAKVPAENIHRIEAEREPQEAARLYVEDLRRHFQIREGEMPRFDVIHRGMGPDGHTASLFPGSPLVRDRTGLAAAVWVETMCEWRITLLPGVLEAARRTAMLAAGADKAAMLKAVIDGPYDPEQRPAQIRPADGEIDWFVDRAAQGG
ncbi:MAG TPA: 6-phosphogluconolactonase [Bryobacteraceae bacterium]|nr:6-phosphogluconolactonase [Bryobacteraceae bacterium]